MVRQKIFGIDGMIQVFRWLGFPRLFFVKIFSGPYFCWTVIAGIFFFVAMRQFFAYTMVRYHAINRLILNTFLGF